MLKKLVAEDYPSPTTVVFDLDNTLYPYPPSHKAALEDALKKLEIATGISRNAVLQGYETARLQIKSQLGATASAHSRLLYFQRTLELLGVRPCISLALDLEQTYWRVFLRNASLFEGARDFLHLLRSKGIKIACVTDLTAQIQFRKLIYFDLDSYFDYLVSSEESGADKPEENSFNTLSEKISLDPKRTWIIGDDVSKDMTGGRRAGYRTFFYRHYYSKNQEYSSEDTDVVFDSFESLGRFVEEIE